MERGQAEALDADDRGRRWTRQAWPSAASTSSPSRSGPAPSPACASGLPPRAGLALATGLPLIGVTSFAAARSFGAGASACRAAARVALESKRAEIFLQCFAPDGPALGAGADRRHPRRPTRSSRRVRVLLAGDAAAAARAVPEGRGETVADAVGPPDPADIARARACRMAAGRAAGSCRGRFISRAPDTTQPAPRSGGAMSISLEPWRAPISSRSPGCTRNASPRMPGTRRRSSGILAMKGAEARLAEEAERPVGLLFAVILADEAEILTLGVAPDCAPARRRAHRCSKIFSLAPARSARAASCSRSRPTTARRSRFTKSIGLPHRRPPPRLLSARAWPGDRRLAAAARLY